MANPKLLIFAKYPAPGSVKTRLCPSLTPEQAAAVHRACVRLVCERAFRIWPVQPILHITPDDSEQRFREFLGPYIPIRKQGAGNLGCRLDRAVRAAFRESNEPVLIVGADSPTMPARLLTDARERLGRDDAVIGPCDDGGFYLLGLKRTRQGIFDRIDWGTERAAAQMKRRISTCGLKVSLLDRWYDLDRPDDLERAANDLTEADEPDSFELRRILSQVLQSKQKRSCAATGRPK